MKTNFGGLCSLSYPLEDVAAFGNLTLKRRTGPRTRAERLPVYCVWRGDICLEDFRRKSSAVKWAKANGGGSNDCPNCKLPIAGHKPCGSFAAAKRKPATVFLLTLTMPSDSDGDYHHYWVCSTREECFRQLAEWVKREEDGFKDDSTGDVDAYFATSDDTYEITEMPVLGTELLA